MGACGFYIDRHRMTSLLTCAWLIRPPIKNQNMRTGKYSFTKKALVLAVAGFLCLVCVSTLCNVLFLCVWLSVPEH